MSVNEPSLRRAYKAKPRPCLYSNQVVLFQGLTSLLHQITSRQESSTIGLYSSEYTVHVPNISSTDSEGSIPTPTCHVGRGKKSQVHDTSINLVTLASS